MRIPFVVALAAVLSLPPAEGAAQQPDTAAVTTALWTLCPGARLRVTDAAARVHEGRCVASAEGVLSLAGPGDGARIPLVEVAEVRARGSAGVWGALAGGVLGVAIGSRFSLRDVGCLHPQNCLHTDRTDRETVSIAAGLLIGTGVGAVLGNAVPVWRRRFPS